MNKIIEQHDKMQDEVREKLIDLFGIDVNEHTPSSYKEIINHDNPIDFLNDSVLAYCYHLIDEMGENPKEEDIKKLENALSKIQSKMEIIDEFEKYFKEIVKKLNSGKLLNLNIEINESIFHLVEVSYLWNEFSCRSKELRLKGLIVDFTQEEFSLAIFNPWFEARKKEKAKLRKTFKRL